MKRPVVRFVTKILSVGIQYQPIIVKVRNHTGLKPEEMIVRLENHTELKPEERILKLENHAGLEFGKKKQYKKKEGL